MTNQRNSVLYVGVTSSLVKRIDKHKGKFYENSFTAKYKIDKLVYYEIYGEAGAALFREKQLKNFKRDKKIQLIKDFNITWRDLFDDMF